MSWKEDIETAVGAIDAWNRRDLEDFLEAWHPEAEWWCVFAKAGP